MKLYQHIYVYKTMFKNVQPKQNDEFNSNIHIHKISHLPFDMLCYVLKMKNDTVRDTLI